MIEAYKPAQISQCDVDILQELILSKRLFGISKSDSSLKVRFVNSFSSFIPAADFSCSLSVNKKRVDIVLEPIAESPFIQRLQKLGGIESFTEEFRDSVIALCAQEIINSLESFFQLPISLWDETNKEEQPSQKKTLYFEAINKKSAVEIRGKMTLPITLVKKVISLASELPYKESPIFANRPLEGELIIGSVKVPYHQWEKLEAGSLIFFDEHSAIVTGEGGFLLKHGKMLSLVFDQEQLKSLALPLTDMTSSNFIPAHQGSLKNNESKMLPEKEGVSMMVELAFSAGTISLSIDEIINLDSNSSLANPLNLSRPLKILAQGEIVGAGELIEINRQYASFVTQLS